jgi:hypothetical protein
VDVCPVASCRLRSAGESYTPCPTDALAKGLADEGISRGQALRPMVATLLGGVLAATPAAAFAQTQTWCFNVCPTVGGTTEPTTCTQAGSKPYCPGFTSREECERYRTRAYPAEFQVGKCYPSSKL